MSDVLTAQRVIDIFKDCLFNDGEDTSNAVTVTGIVNKVGFNPDRLNTNKADIEAMLYELPTDFRESEGGGWSFLNACLDKEGNQWTGLHRTMEQLFLLGLAIDKVSLLVPKELWDMFPGGMPYYVIK